MAGHLDAYLGIKKLAIRGYCSMSTRVLCDAPRQ